MPFDFSPDSENIRIAQDRQAETISDTTASIDVFNQYVMDTLETHDDTIAKVWYPPIYVEIQGERYWISLHDKVLQSEDWTVDTLKGHIHIHKDWREYHVSLAKGELEFSTPWINRMIWSYSEKMKQFLVDWKPIERIEAIHIPKHWPISVVASIMNDDGEVRADSIAVNREILNYLIPQDPLPHGVVKSYNHETKTTTNTIYIDQIPQIFIDDIINAVNAMNEKSINRFKMMLVDSFSIQFDQIEKDTTDNQTADAK